MIEQAETVSYHVFQVMMVGGRIIQLLPILRRIVDVFRLLKFCKMNE